MQCVSLEGPARCMLIWVRHAAALCLIFSFPTCSELHYYLMRSFHSWQPLELEEGFLHRTGPLTVVKIQSWGVFSLLFAGGVTPYNTVPLCFPHSIWRKVLWRGEAFFCGWDVLVGPDGMCCGWQNAGRVGLLQTPPSGAALQKGAGLGLHFCIHWVACLAAPAWLSPHIILFGLGQSRSPQLRLSQLFPLLHPPPHLHHLTGLTRFP